MVPTNTSKTFSLKVFQVTKKHARWEGYDLFSKKLRYYVNFDSFLGLLKISQIDIHFAYYEYLHASEVK